MAEIINKLSSKRFLSIVKELKNKEKRKYDKISIGLFELLIKIQNYKQNDKNYTGLSTKTLKLSTFVYRSYINRKNYD